MYPKAFYNKCTKIHKWKYNSPITFMLPVGQEPGNQEQWSCLLDSSRTWAVSQGLCWLSQSMFRKQPDQVMRFICSLLILQIGLCLSARLHLTQGLNNLQFRVRKCFTNYLNHPLSRDYSLVCFKGGHLISVLDVPHIFILDLFSYITSL